MCKHLTATITGVVESAKVCPKLFNNFVTYLLHTYKARETLKNIIFRYLEIAIAIYF